MSADVLLCSPTILSASVGLEETSYLHFWDGPMTPKRAGPQDSVSFNRVSGKCEDFFSTHY